uniref:Rhodanese domain-containing protein n=1 Tax=Ascaris lumbricoides TaxID=6252 RepID=A0A0M3HIA5_ASCLU
VKGSHIGGARNTPIVEVVSNEGIEECGFEKGKPVITSCNRGLQASLLAMVLEYADETLKPRVYFGSIKELELRDPEIISSGHVFIP